MKTVLPNPEDSSISSAVRSSESALTSSLVRRAKGGDASALNSLCDLYYEQMRLIVRRHLGDGMRSMVDSGDILQETFQQAIAGLRTFQMRSRASLIRWLSKIAENKIKEAVKFHTASKRDRNKQLAGDGLQLVAEKSDPLSNAAREEELRHLRECLRKLPDHYRESIILRDFARCDFQQVAIMTKRPSSDAARMIHAAALRALQKIMQHRTKS